MIMMNAYNNNDKNKRNRLYTLLLLKLTLTSQTNQY